MKTFNTLFLLLIAFISSCHNEEIPQNSVDNTYKNPYVLQARKKPLPVLKKRSNLRTISSDCPDLTKSPYHKIGAMYKIGNGIIGHPDNIGNNSVINIKSLLNDRKTSKFIHNTKINNTRLNISTFSNENDINETINKKINFNGALRLNVLGFKANIESTYKKVFHQETHQNNKSFRGKLDLIYDAQKIEIDNTDLVLKTIGYRNLDDSFLYLLYMGSIDKFLNNNGSFIISKFYTGARLSVLYMANSESTNNTKIDSLEFTSSMKASFKWFSLGDKPGLEIGFKKEENSTNNVKKDFSEFKCFLQTFGGTPGFQPPTNVMDLKTSNPVDFGEWYRSLSKEDNHVIVDIGDKGLVPISSFILEQNYRDRINRFIESNGSIEFKNTIEPSIDMVRLRFEGSRYEPDEAVWVMNTRHGEKIMFNINNGDIDQKYNYSEEYSKLLSKLKTIFDCKITGNNKCFFGTGLVGYNNNYYEYGWNGVESIKFNFWSDNIFKFKNPYSNIWYIYDKDSKVAFSYYSDEDDESYITDLYGITDWVDGLTEKKISMSSLIKNYIIIGL